MHLNKTKLLRRDNSWKSYIVSNSFSQNLKQKISHHNREKLSRDWASWTFGIGNNNNSNELLAKFPRKEHPNYVGTSPNQTSKNILNIERKKKQESLKR